MNRYLSLACSLVAFFYLSSCESYSEPTEKKHQSDQPIVLTSFYPKEGGARDKILLDGKNFGTDVSKIKVYFNNARASVVSSSGSRIYAIVPRLPGDNPRISVVVDTDSVAYEETYAYHTQTLVSTVSGDRADQCLCMISMVTGNGERASLPEHSPPLRCMANILIWMPKAIFSCHGVTAVHLESPG